MTLEDILSVYENGPKATDSSDVIKPAYLISWGVKKLSDLSGGSSKLFSEYMLIIANRETGQHVEIKGPPFDKVAIHPKLKKFVKDYLRTVVLSWGHFYKGTGSTSFYANNSEPIIAAIYKRNVLDWAQQNIGWSPDEYPNKLCDLIRNQGRNQFTYDYRMGLDPYSTYGWAKAEGSSQDAAYAVIDENYEEAMNGATKVTSLPNPVTGVK